MTEDAEPFPDWLKGARTPAAGFRKLLMHLGELSEASQDEKIDAFLKGIDAIRAHIGEFSITRAFDASYPGTSEMNVTVFVGKRGPTATPVIAFDAAGRIWTGSLEGSVGVTPDGRPVFNAFRANRVG